MFLTDVRVLRATPAFWLAAKVAPRTFQLVERSRVVPPNTTDRQYTTQLDEMMKTSQMTAQVVAERAAGLPVRIVTSVRVGGMLRGTPAVRCFRLGDRIVGIDGHRVGRVLDVQRATRRQPPGRRFDLMLERDGRKQRVSCATYADKRVPRFGVMLRDVVEDYKLPVVVRYDLPHVNGPSAGLMFALEIYRELTGKDLTGKHDVAGTGVLSLDGRVSPIEGARQKIAAAKRAGAAVFVIPRENAGDVAGTTGITVVPVSSFDDAVKALTALARPTQRAN